MRLLLLLCCLCAPDAFALSLAHSPVLCAIVDLPFAIKSIMLLYRSSRSPHTPSSFLILIIRSRFAFHSVRPPKAARLWHDARHTKWDVVNMSTIYAMERDTIDRSVLTAHPSQPLTLECILLVFLTGDLVRWKIRNIRPAKGMFVEVKNIACLLRYLEWFFRCLVTSIVSSFAYAYNLSAWCFFYGILCTLQKPLLKPLCYDSIVFDCSLEIWRLILHHHYIQSSRRYLRLKICKQKYF